MQVKEAVDAETGKRLSWTDLISYAARVRTKGSFDAILASKAAPGNEALLVKAYGNEFPARSRRACFAFAFVTGAEWPAASPQNPPLFGVDAEGPGPAGGVIVFANGEPPAPPRHFIEPFVTSVATYNGDSFVNGVGAYACRDAIWCAACAVCAARPHAAAGAALPAPTRAISYDARCG